MDTMITIGAEAQHNFVPWDSRRRFSDLVSRGRERSMHDPV